MNAAAAAAAAAGLQTFVIGDRPTPRPGGRDIMARISYTHAP